MKLMVKIIYSRILHHKFIMALIVVLMYHQIILFQQIHLKD